MIQCHHRGLLAALLLLPAAGHAMDNEEYDACMLQYQKGVQTNYGWQLIKEACTKLYKESAFLFSDEEVYYRCILQNIPGVENDRAIESIRQVCRTQSQD